MKLTRTLLLTFAGTFGSVSACTAGAPTESSKDDPVAGGDGDSQGDGDIMVGSGGQSNDLDLTMQPTPATCGDGVLDDNEACDDGDLDSGDGCYENCLVVEEGFICPIPGGSCIPFAKCGEERKSVV